MGKRHLMILLLVVALVLAFLAGTATVSSSGPPAPQTVTLAQLAAIQASGALLLDQGLVSVYLPIVLRR